MKVLVLLLALLCAAASPAVAVDASADFLFGVSQNAWPVEVQGRFSVGPGAVELAYVQEGFSTDTAQVYGSVVELVASTGVGSIALGTGLRAWSEQHWAAGEVVNAAGDQEPIAFLSAPVALGLAALEARATYGASGLAWLAVAGVDVEGLQLLAGYRHWPMEGWYSGPVFSVGVTF